MRLKPDVVPVGVRVEHGFNTKKVRLKLPTADVVLIEFPCFNTKKVRLKPTEDAMKKWIIEAFQYQKGAIKTANAREGRIAFDGFNTKKVRLKPSSAQLRKCSTALFQYQKGAIKTVCFARTRGRPRRFQYQKGAIKTKQRRYDVTASASVSIPKRCD